MLAQFPVQISLADSENLGCIPPVSLAGLNRHSDVGKFRFLQRRQWRVLCKSTGLGSRPHIAQGSGQVLGQNLRSFTEYESIWALIAAFLSRWTAMSRDSSGICGASRHTVTVGFLATMVFAIGQRVLPAFSGMRLLFSTN